MEISFYHYRWDVMKEHAALRLRERELHSVL
jgi:hypothetical protein